MNCNFKELKLEKIEILKILEQTVFEFGVVKLNQTHVPNH